MTKSEREQIKKCFDLAIKYDSMVHMMSPTSEFSEITIRLSELLGEELMFASIGTFAPKESAYTNLFTNFFTSIDTYMRSEESE